MADDVTDERGGEDQIAALIGIRGLDCMVAAILKVWWGLYNI